MYNKIISNFFQKIFFNSKEIILPLRPLIMVLTHGVIGNTPVFGTVILGSSPSGSTKALRKKGFFYFI